MDDFLAELKKTQDRHHQSLKRYFSTLPDHGTPLKEAMRYGALLGGKRIRPVWVYWVGKMLGASEEQLDAPAAAVECIHAYSLIHDDLPAMDDDSLRRGHPTCHVQFDEATAILAGDALQTLAFELLSHTESLDCQIRIEMIKALSQASGLKGMCGGQALDIAATDQLISLEELKYLHSLKTGALIHVSVKLGYLAAGHQNDEVTQALDQVAKNVGLAFQIQDDVLDVVSDTETLGKPQGSDLSLNKSTYPKLMGLEAAQQKANTLFEEAVGILRALPYNSAPLIGLVQYLAHRDH